MVGASCELCKGLGKDEAWNQKSDLDGLEPTYGRRFDCAHLEENQDGAFVRFVRADRLRDCLLSRREKSEFKLLRPVFAEGRPILRIFAQEIAPGDLIMCVWSKRAQFCKHWAEVYGIRLMDVFDIPEIGESTSISEARGGIEESASSSSTEVRLRFESFRVGET
jgi:hypothetical protein